MTGRGRRMRLSPLPYYGGKSGGHGPHILGQWVSSLLPDDTQTLYAEPYAGMLGILLQRAPSKLEIVNDLNERIVNWWRVVRDHPDELARMMQYTPHSELEYHRAFSSMDTGSDIERARAFTVAVSQGIKHTDERSGWIRKYSINGAFGSPYHSRIEPLSNRIRHVQLFCRPASRIIERVGRVPQSIMYIDPPYADADTSAYSVVLDEREALLELLPTAAGKVAISGYGDEWDELDWHRHTMETVWYGIGLDEGLQPRTEVLWTNFRPEQNERLL